jgi:hypothetical protein
LPVPRPLYLVRHIKVKRHRIRRNRNAPLLLSLRRRCDAYLVSYIARGSRAVRIAGGVAFGSTSLLHTARHGKQAAAVRRVGRGGAPAGILLRVGVGTARAGRSTDTALYSLLPACFSPPPAFGAVDGRAAALLNFKPPAGAFRRCDGVSRLVGGDALTLTHTR